MAIHLSPPLSSLSFFDNPLPALRSSQQLPPPDTLNVSISVFKNYLSPPSRYFIKIGSLVHIVLSVSLMPRTRSDTEHVLNKYLLNQRNQHWCQHAYREWGWSHRSEPHLNHLSTPQPTCDDGISSQQGQIFWLFRKASYLHLHPEIPFLQNPGNKTIKQGHGQYLFSRLQLVTVHLKRGSEEAAGGPRVRQRTQ